MLIPSALPPAHGVRPVHISRRGFSRVLQQPVANYVGDSVYLGPLDDSTVWATTNCSIGYDTTYYKCGDANFRSLRVTPAGSSTMSLIRKTISATDLSGTHVMLRVYVPEGSGNSDYEKILRIQLAVKDSAANKNTYYLWHPQPYGHPGWYELNFLIGEPDDVTTPAVDLTDIITIDLFVLTTVSTYTPEVVFDHLEFYNPKNTKGLVLVRLDGPYDRAWQGCAYMQAQKLTGTSRKLRASLCVSTAVSEAAASLLTATQIHDLQLAGHFVMMYLRDWDSTAQADKLPLLDKWQEWMSESGFGSGVRYVAHSGSYNWTYEDRTEIAPARFDAVFGGVDEYKYNHTRGLWNPRWCQWAHFSSGSGTLADRIASAASEKGLLILGAHLIDDAELTQFKTDIDLIVTEINNGTLIPVTFHELISGAGLV